MCSPFRVLAQDVLDGNRPVQLLSLMTDSLLWGKNPVGYHLTSNLLHAGNAVLLFLLLVQDLPCKAGSHAGRRSATALIFAAHPVLVEPVAEVSSREDLLATFFLLDLRSARLALGEWQGARPGLLWAPCWRYHWRAVPRKRASRRLSSSCLCGLLFRGEAPLRRWLVLSGGALLAGCRLPGRAVFAPAGGIGDLSLQAGVSGRFSCGSFSSFSHSSGPSRFSRSFCRSVSPPTYVAQECARHVDSRRWWSPWRFSCRRRALAAWKSRLAAFGVAIILARAGARFELHPHLSSAGGSLPLPSHGWACDHSSAECCFLASRRHYLFTVLLARVGCVVLVLASLSVRRQLVFANSLNLWTDTFAKSPYLRYGGK